MGRARLAKFKNFPPNLYQNPAGYFYYKNPKSGKQRGLGREKAHAFAEARAANATLAAMGPSSLSDWVAGKTAYTLAEWLPVYKGLWLEKEKRADATIRSCTTYIKKTENADFVWMKLPDIGTAHIAKFVGDVEKESGSPSGLALRARLSDIFRFAETQGLIEQGKNPVTATYPPKRDVKRGRLSLEQFHAIHACAPSWLQRAMMLAICTAQRREDIADMKFADFKDGYLHVVQGKSQGQVKLQQDGDIRLTKVGVSVAEAVAACRDNILSRYMIHHTRHQGTAKPGNRLSANGISNAFQEAREEAGIKAEEGRTPPSFHEIRSLAERLFREEFGAEFAQAMLGHKNASMTAKYDDLRGGWQVVSVKTN